MGIFLLKYDKSNLRDDPAILQNSGGMSALRTTPRTFMVRKMILVTKARLGDVHYYQYDLKKEPTLRELLRSVIGPIILHGTNFKVKLKVLRNLHCQ